jgi:thioredoxin reductase (NADPH)
MYSGGQTMQEYDVIILGGGPAGLTAGLYTSRYGLKSLLIERGLYGGQIVNARTVENYPGFPAGVSGMDLGQLMYDQAIKFSLQTENDEVLGLSRADGGFQIKLSDSTIQAKSVIVATGSNYRKLNVEGEERLLGRGVSYCATCDGFLYKNMDVAVVGGGDTAVTDALELAEHASTVYLIHRRDQLRASEINQKQVFASSKIKIIWDSVVISIDGQDKVSNVIIKNIKSGQQADLTISGLFVAVGLEPNSEIVKNIVLLDESHNVITDELMSTSVPGIFAAGDIRRNSARQVATAVGDGATAAKSAFKHVRGHD